MRLPTRFAPQFLRRSGLGLYLSVALLAASPHAARADDDAPEHYDGRLQGYTPTVEAKSSSVGLTWVLLVVLGGACVSVMFMDAKRTHLD